MTISPVPATTPTAQRLLDLLPAVYRLRDPEQGHVLRELLGVLADQVDVLSEEIAQLYDDQFVETCATWAAPYIGDLIGYRVLHGVVPDVASPRAEVANTVAYRRRKGTASVLEQLARDVTGWPARAVEFFERLVTTQYLNHTRPHARATAGMRDHEALAWIGQQNAAFDDLAHTADVRRIAARRPSGTGRHNIPNIGLFLWRTEAVALARSHMVGQADGRRFRFDALGADAPLFGLPRTEPEITHLAEPFDVPLPLGRRWLGDHLDAYYGRGRTLLLERQAAGGDPVPIGREKIRVCDLSDVPGGGGAWAHEPPPGEVAVDPVLGRVYAGDAVPAGERLLGTSAYGQAVPVGAGASTRRLLVTPEPRQVALAGENLQPHLATVAAGGTVEVADNAVYPQSLTVTTTAAPAGQPETELHLVAGAGVRPSLVLATSLRLDLAPRTTVVLDGLLLSGGPLVVDEVGDTEPRTVVLRNCTLVPGHARTPDGLPKQADRASLLVLDPFVRVVVDRCVLGPVVAVEGSRVELTDSVVDASDPEAVAVCGRGVPTGGGLRTVATVADVVVGDGTTPAGEVDLHECTILGGIHATQLDASNSLLVATLPVGDPRKAAVHARRRQIGCVRYSFVPEGSRTGRRYRCQPDPDDPAGVRRATVPRFTSMRFGDPAYLQLSTATPDAIRRGADDESEMGVTHLLFTPQRESNLLLRLDEYLRFGLEAGFFYAT
jgi:hypothetical protein